MKVWGPSEISIWNDFIKVWPTGTKAFDGLTKWLEWSQKMILSKFEVGIEPGRWEKLESSESSEMKI